MDYLEIVLNGITIKSNRIELSNYFFREFKKAKKEHYTEASFFGGCEIVVKKLKSICESRKNDRKMELNKMIILTESKKERTDFKKEARDLENQNFPINLMVETNNRYTGQLYFNEILEIERNLKITQLELQQNATNKHLKKTEKDLEKLQPQQLIVKSNNKHQQEIKENLHNEYFKSNTFLIFKKYCDEYIIDNTCRTDLSVLFQLFDKDSFFVETIELKHYLMFLKKYLKYDESTLKKVNINTKPNIVRTNNYKRIKDNLKITL